MAIFNTSNRKQINTKAITCILQSVIYPDSIDRQDDKKRKKLKLLITISIVSVTFCVFLYCLLCFVRRYILPTFSYRGFLTTIETLCLNHTYWLYFLTLQTFFSNIVPFIFAFGFNYSETKMRGKCIWDYHHNNWKKWIIFYSFLQRPILHSNLVLTPFESDNVLLNQQAGVIVKKQQIQHPYMSKPVLPHIFVSMYVSSISIKH